MPKSETFTNRYGHDFKLWSNDSEDRDWLETLRDAAEVTGIMLEYDHDGLTGEVKFGVYSECSEAVCLVPLSELVRRSAIIHGPEDFGRLHAELKKALEFVEAKMASRVNA
jgi:hypothetical protein